ncbi:BTAD domain-containing putative transcriptional regulator [Actinomadura sp. DC4]|uniref:BTAD domain-containing putative transcriptional regulator n=1 Tax=Actinomadura sp. DC4 TaxID=3055069 RepID=UPI0025AF2DB4|nr:BTAD domain-containing putative transcriptional regulator [Actinomadura sp. DC4]MDN3356912.1 BTAD domain-containing putative transcriptional regulator [Actinomadura sp. DC4]
MLGPLQVWGAGGGPVEVRGARLRLLLIRLALDPGRVVTADRLADDLWGDDAPADPAGALQTLVARLRRSFGAERDVIASHPSGYRLDLPPEHVDVRTFEKAAQEGRTALDAGDPLRAAELLRAGLGLWRGTPLAEAADATFAVASVARLEETRLAMVEDRIAADLAAGTPVEIAEVEELTRAHPLRERLHARLVRALHAAGRRAEALEAYERIRGRLAERLGVDPGAELRDAHLAALRTAPRRGGVPARATSFVGRTEELAGVRAALGRSRLVTITGFGGTGKTRLALEAAAGRQGPVRLVELGAVADPARVLPAVVAAVGDGDAGVFGTDAVADPLDRLAAMLAGHETLLVLDNCEHVIEAAARLAEHLLAAAPEVTLLATSREPLAVAGEALFPLAPLGLPEPGADPRTAAAVRLFADRAAAVRPGFTVTDAGPGDVVRVCRELDGIPLAIELAAARLRSLTLGQLIDRIGDRFGLLERGSRTAQPRHRTLRAVVDWSWELLDDGERLVLRRMAVFLGGATVRAVAAVCGRDEPVDLLAGLVDKSLLIMSEDDLGVRYRLLETVREYAAERLEEAGETAAARDAHAAFFLAYAETAEPLLRGHEQLRVLGRLDAEQGNLDAALDHAITGGDPETALRMILARTWAWVIRGRGREAGEWARAVLGLVGDTAPPGLELAHGICVLTAPSADRAQLLRALEVTQSSDRPAALGAWTIAGGYAGERAAVRDRAAAVVERFGAHPDPWLRAMAAMAYGLVQFEYTPGGAGRAEEHLSRALDGFVAVGDRWGEAVCLFALGLVLANRGSWADTVRVLERARSRAAEVGGVEEIPAPMMLLVQLGQARLRAGEVAGARADLEQALANAERGVDPVAPARVRHALGDLAYAAGDLPAAAAHLRAALTVTPDDGAPAQFLALAHLSAARAEAALGDHDRAAELRERSLTLIAGTGDNVARATVLEGVAEFLPDSEDAVALLGAARTLRGIEDTNDPAVRALLDRCRADLGEERFAATWERGRGLSRPESVALQPRDRR